mgnify:CR=1 FL=1
MGEEIDGAYVTGHSVGAPKHQQRACSVAAPVKEFKVASTLADVANRPVLSRLPASAPSVFCGSSPCSRRSGVPETALPRSVSSRGLSLRSARPPERFGPATSQGRAMCAYEFARRQCLRASNPVNVSNRRNNSRGCFNNQYIAALRKPDLGLGSVRQ